MTENPFFLFRLVCPRCRFRKCIKFRLTEKECRKNYHFRWLAEQLLILPMVQKSLICRLLLPLLNGKCIEAEERQKFGTAFGTDPANDNYEYFRSSNYDSSNASILTRYKKYNNTQGNSPTNNSSPESYPTSATTYPDIEDLDRDQTMNTVESYYQYKVSLNKNDLVVGQNHIVDEKRVRVRLDDGSEKEYRWLQFRIQVSTPDEVVNDITGFNSIRFMRMFLHGFNEKVKLRINRFLFE